MKKAKNTPDIKKVKQRILLSAVVYPYGVVNEVIELEIARYSP